MTTDELCYACPVVAGFVCWVALGRPGEPDVFDRITVDADGQPHMPEPDRGQIKVTATACQDHVAFLEFAFLEVFGGCNGDGTRYGYEQHHRRPTYPVGRSYGDEPAYLSALAALQSLARS